MGKGWIPSRWDCDYHLHTTSPNGLQETLKAEGVKPNDRVFVVVSKNSRFDRQQLFRSRAAGEDWNDTPLLERDGIRDLVGVADGITRIEWEHGEFTVLEVQAEQLRGEVFEGGESSVLIRVAAPKLRTIYTPKADGGTSIDVEG